MQMKPASICIAAALAGWMALSSANIAADNATTPAVATHSERKAILDAVRNEIKQLHGLRVVFVVRQLKIANNWAWLHAQPQSQDGKSRHEDVVVLLQKRAGRWEIMDMPCSEEDNPDCLGAPDFLNRLQLRIKGIPPEILPP
ncbi:MAG: hypothetical protein WC029_04870 [Sulfuricella sp.]|jgi:hypothetical protein